MRIVHRRSGYRACKRLLDRTPDMDTDDDAVRPMYTGRGGASTSSNAGAADVNGHIPSRSDFLAICTRSRARRGTEGADVFPDVHPGAVSRIRSRAGCVRRGWPATLSSARQTVRNIRPTHTPTTTSQSSSTAPQPISGRRRYARGSCAAPGPNYGPRDDSADVSTDASAGCQPCLPSSLPSI